MLPNIILYFDARKVWCIFVLAILKPNLISLESATFF